MFFQDFFFILNLVRGFPLEFFNTVIPTQIFLQSRNPHPASRIQHPVISMGTSIAILHPLYTMELKQRRRRRQRERQWTNRFWLAKKKTALHMHHAFSHTALPFSHDYKVKIHSFTFCRGLEHKTTVFSSFSRTLKQSLRIQLQRSLPTFDELNQIGWNKRDKVWGSGNSLFKCRFRNRGRRLCLKVMFHGTIRNDDS